MKRRERNERMHSSGSVTIFRRLVVVTEDGASKLPVRFRVYQMATRCGGRREKNKVGRGSVSTLEGICDASFCFIAVSFRKGNCCRTV